MIRMSFFNSHGQRVMPIFGKGGVRSTGGAGVFTDGTSLLAIQNKLIIFGEPCTVNDMVTHCFKWVLINRK